MRVVKVIDIFISCPGQVIDDRNIIVQTVDSINISFRKHNEPIILQVLHCDNAAASSISNRAQDAIFDQIGNYDVYVGLMHTKFGTSTGPQFGSGTEEEFKSAIKAYKNKGCAEVSFLFRRVDENKLNNKEKKEYGRVKKFKETVVQPSGVYTKPYDTSSVSMEVRSIIENVISSTKILKNLNARGDESRLCIENIVELLKI